MCAQPNPPWRTQKGTNDIGAQSNRALPCNEKRLRIQVNTQTVVGGSSHWPRCVALQHPTFPCFSNDQCLQLSAQHWFLLHTCTTRLWLTTKTQQTCRRKIVPWSITKAAMKQFETLQQTWRIVELPSLQGDNCFVHASSAICYPHKTAWHLPCLAGTWDLGAETWTLKPRTWDQETRNLWHGN